MPASTYLAIVAALLMLSSSGCAWTNSACFFMVPRLEEAQDSHERAVRRKPLDAVDVVEAEPPDRVVLPRLRDRFPGHQTGGRDPEDQAGADLDHGFEPAGDLDDAAQLLGDLAHRSRLGRLNRLDLAARELPTTVGPTSTQHAIVAQ